MAFEYINEEYDEAMDFLDKGSRSKYTRSPSSCKFESDQGGTQYIMIMMITTRVRKS